MIQKKGRRNWTNPLVCARRGVRERQVGYHRQADGRHRDMQLQRLDRPSKSREKRPSRSRSRSRSRSTSRSRPGPLSDRSRSRSKSRDSHYDDSDHSSCPSRDDYTDSYSDSDSASDVENSKQKKSHMTMAPRPVRKQRRTVRYTQSWCWHACSLQAKSTADRVERATVCGKVMIVMIVSICITFTWIGIDQGIYQKDPPKKCFKVGTDVESPVDTSESRCGTEFPQFRCRTGSCCSYWGYCGVEEDEFCDERAQGDWREDYICDLWYASIDDSGSSHAVPTPTPTQ